MKSIVILGGGFAGLWAALAAAHEAEEHDGEINITLMSKDRYLTMRPRLYERNPELFREPLAPVLDPIGVSFVEGIACEIETKHRSITFSRPEGETSSLGYDRLIVAAGSIGMALPVPGADENSWDIDTYESAVALDNHLHRVMQKPDAPGHGTFVVVGGGFTGIELAAEMRSRLAVHGEPDMVEKARVILLERAEVIGPELGAGPRPIIEEALRRAKVETRLGLRVTEIGPDGVTLDNGEHIETVTTILTVGLRANRIAEKLPVALDELGRLPVDEFLRVENVDGVYATGDIARAYVDDENLALMSCQHALLMGKFAGYNAARDLLELPLRPYRQPDYVTCLDLGSSGAVFTSGWDRQVQSSGEEAKQLKRWINSERIYPPKNDRDAILAAAHIDAGRKR